MKYLHAILCYAPNFHEDPHGGTPLAEIVLGVEDDKQTPELHDGLRYLGLEPPDDSVLQYTFNAIFNEPAVEPQWTHGAVKLWVLKRFPAK